MVAHLAEGLKQLTFTGCQLLTKLSVNHPSFTVYLHIINNYNS